MRFRQKEHLVMCGNHISAYGIGFCSTHVDKLTFMGVVEYSLGVTAYFGMHYATYGIVFFTTVCIGQQSMFL